MTPPKLSPEVAGALDWLAARLRPCEWCGAMFPAASRRHRYCRASHRVMAAKARAREQKGG